MRNKLTDTVVAVCLVFAAALLLIEAVGCQSSSASSSDASAASADKNPIAKMMAVPDKKAGSQLWAENCTRCHNARPPQAYSDGQWSTIVHHMRLRADLTGEEARLVRDFLQASN